MISAVLDDLKPQFRILQTLYDIEELIFNTESTDFKKKADPLLKFITENQSCVPYLVQALSTFQLVRPKRTEEYKFITEFLISKSTEFAKNWALYFDSFYQYFRDKLELFSPKNLPNQQGENIDPEFNNFIINDDAEGLSSYVSSHFPFNFNKIIGDYQLTPVEYAAFLGSAKCFKYLLLNTEKFEFNKTAKAAICGGNNEIIRILEQRGINFDHCQNYAILSHHNEIAEWLFRQYDCSNNQGGLLFFSNDSPISLAISALNIKCAIYLCKQAISVEQILIQICKINYPSFPFFKYIFETFKEKDPTIARRVIVSLCSSVNPSFEILKYLVEHGADLNARFSFQDSSYTLVECLCFPNEALLSREGIKFFRPRQRIFIECIEYLLDQDCDYRLQEVIKFLSKSKESYFDALKLFLERIDDFNTCSPNPMQLICQNRNIPIEGVKYIIEHGFKYSLCKNCRNPLILYCSTEDPKPEILRLLVDACIDVNDKSNEQRSPDALVSLCTSQKPSFPAIKFLVESGADPKRLTSSTLYTLSCRPNSAEALQFLLKNGGLEIARNDIRLFYNTIRNDNMDIDAFKCFVDNELETAGLYELFSKLSTIKNVKVDFLTYVIGKGIDFKSPQCLNILKKIFTSKSTGPQTVNAILSGGANIKEYLDSKERTFEEVVFFYKIVAQSSNTAKQLIEYFAGDKDEITNMLICICYAVTLNIKPPNQGQNQNQNTIIFGIRPQDDIGLNTRELDNILKMLTESGADMNRTLDRFQKHEIPVQILCSSQYNNDQNTRLLTNIIERGYDVNTWITTDSCNVTLLYYAAVIANLNIGIIGFLLKKGADPKAEVTLKDNTKTTLLEQVCSQKKLNSQLIALLIQNGADVNRETADGQILLQKLFTYTSEPPADVVKAFLEKGADKQKVVNYLKSIQNPRINVNKAIQLLNNIEKSLNK